MLPCQPSIVEFDLRNLHSRPQMIVQKRPKFFSPTIHRWSLCGHTLRTWSRPSSTRLARTLYGCLLTLREVEVPVSYIRGRSQNLHVNAIAAQLRWGIVSSP